MKLQMLTLTVLLALALTSGVGLAETVKLPDETTVIGEEAFYGDASIVDVKLPDGIARIEARAFANSAVKSVDLPDSLTFIDDTAFDATPLKTVTAAEGSYAYEWAVKHGYIGSDETPADEFEYALWNGHCTIIQYTGSRADVRVPRQIEGCAVTGIGEYAFSQCEGLERVVIPDGVAHIGEYAFYHCASLASVVIPDSVADIGEFAFCHCERLAGVDIPNGVAIVSDYAFAHCYSLTRVNLPDTVTRIGVGAFERCGSLTDVDIPNGVIGIGDSAFARCERLTRVRLPDSLAYIDDTAFDGTGLTTVVASEGSYAYDWAVGRGYIEVEEAPASAFEYRIEGGKCEITRYRGEYAIVRIPGRIEGYPVTGIGAGAFYGCERLTRVILPNSVTAIGGSAFAYCDDLKSVAIPDSVVSIGDLAFSFCASLKSIAVGDGSENFASMGGVLFDKAQKTLLCCPGGVEDDYSIPNSVTRIGNGAFAGCVGLTDVTIPNGITDIGDAAFSGCVSLTRVDIPASVTHIGELAFSFCVSMVSIAVDPGNAQYANANDALYDRARETLICCPGGKMDIFTIPNGTTGILTGAFTGCVSLAGVDIPNSVTRIDGYTFCYCDSLTVVAIPDSVSDIDAEAFVDCDSLEFVCGAAGSYAEQWAKENGYTFVAL